MGLGPALVGSRADLSHLPPHPHNSLVTTTFSEDSTLMAAGFSESYIRLWNLKGGKLQGMRTDFDSDEIHDGTSFLHLFFFTSHRLPIARLVHHLALGGVQLPLSRSLLTSLLLASQQTTSKSFAQRKRLRPAS